MSATVELYEDVSGTLTVICGDEGRSGVGRNEMTFLDDARGAAEEGMADWGCDDVDVEEFLAEVERCEERRVHDISQVATWDHDDGVLTIHVPPGTAGREYLGIADDDDDEFPMSLRPDGAGGWDFVDDEEA